MKMSKRVVNICIFAAVVVAAILIDQITKFCFEGIVQSLIGDFLWITSVHNTGAAFSMLEGARWWFVGIGLVCFVAIALLVAMKLVSTDKLFVVSLSLVAGGIVGNVIDRIAFSYVRDFIDFRFSGFAIFNFADSFLCVGCALLVLWMILLSVRDAKQKKLSQKGDAKNE